MKILLRDIKPNPQQPRRDFDKAALTELAESIKAVGLIQPVVVEEIIPGKYFIIDGERRWRACQMISGLNSIEVVIRDPLPEGDKDRLVQGMVANVQRKDLNAMEEARGYHKLVTEFGLSVNRIAIMTGKNIMTIKSRLELMELDDQCQALIENSKLPCDRRLTNALLTLPVEPRVKLAEKICQGNISIKSSLNAVNKIREVLESQTAEAQPKTSSVPMIKLAEKKATRNQRQWGLLQQVGKVPPWKEFENAAEMTCNACSLRDLSSETICGDCPAVHFVTQLLKETSK